MLGYKQSTLASMSIGPFGLSERWNLEGFDADFPRGRKWQWPSVVECCRSLRPLETGTLALCLVWPSTLFLVVWYWTDSVGPKVPPFTAPIRGWGVQTVLPTLIFCHIFYSYAEGDQNIPSICCCHDSVCQSAQPIVALPVKNRFYIEIFKKANINDSRNLCSIVGPVL